MPPGRLPWEVFQARPTRRSSQGTAQDTLEGLCLSAGLRTPLVRPGGAGGGVWVEGRLGVSAESAGPPARSRIKWKTEELFRKTSIHMLEICRSLRMVYLHWRIAVTSTYTFNSSTNLGLQN
ncbi:hypothetical protein CHARACLAT_027590 [Characodon lateralis]|uniref:Uncharacterized protein n=1 Tax=Characodon lateralis TaxID=208331 RepID=A0ABU7DME3_9TELE|nr:hypothetical protein [Characodon lateralis]